MLEPSFFFFFYSAHGMVIPIFRVGIYISTSPIQKPPRHVKSLSPTLYVGHVRLTVIIGVT